MVARAKEDGWIWDVATHQKVLKVLERLSVLGEARN